MTAEIFKKQIIAVVEVWEDWIVFPPDYTADLRTRLDGASGQADEPRPTVEDAPPPEVAPSYAAKFKTSSFQPATASEDTGGNEDVDGIAFDDVDGDPVDGSPLGTGGDDVDGEPVPMDVSPPWH